MSGTPEKPKIRRFEEKTVFIGMNPSTGRKYFERQKVRVPDPDTPPEEPPVEGSLQKPKDIGIPRWQQNELDD